MKKQKSSWKNLNRSCWTHKRVSLYIYFLLQLNSSFYKSIFLDYESLQNQLNLLIIQNNEEISKFDEIMKTKETETNRLEAVIKEKEQTIANLEERVRKIAMSKQKTVRMNIVESDKTAEEQAKENQEVVQSFFIRLSKFWYEKIN